MHQRWDGDRSTMKGGEVDDGDCDDVDGGQKKEDTILVDAMLIELCSYNIRWFMHLRPLLLSTRWRKVGASSTTNGRCWRILYTLAWLQRAEVEYWMGRYLSQQLVWGWCWQTGRAMTRTRRQTPKGVGTVQRQDWVVWESIDVDVINRNNPLEVGPIEDGQKRTLRPAGGSTPSWNKLSSGRCWRSVRSNTKMLGWLLRVVAVDIKPWSWQGWVKTLEKICSNTGRYAGQTSN